MKANARRGLWCLWSVGTLIWVAPHFGIGGWSWLGIVGLVATATRSEQPSRNAGPAGQHAPCVVPGCCPTTPTGASGRSAHRLGTRGVLEATGIAAEELLTHITPLDALLPWRECLSQIDYDRQMTLIAQLPALRG